MARVATAPNVRPGSLAVIWTRSLRYYVLDPTLSAWLGPQVPVTVWRVVLAVHVLETLAVGFPAWVTLA